MDCRIAGAASSRCGARTSLLLFIDLIKVFAFCGLLVSLLRDKQSQRCRLVSLSLISRELCRSRAGKLRSNVASARYGRVEYFGR